MFGPPWWCKTLLLQVWDFFGGDDHGELTSMGVWEWPTPFTVPWLALNYYGLGSLPHLGEGIPHGPSLWGQTCPLSWLNLLAPDKRRR